MKVSRTEQANSDHILYSIKNTANAINSIFTKVSTNKSAAGVSSQKIAEALKKDIYARNSFGLPTTGEHIGEHIKLINSSNVMQVYNEYIELTGRKESLFTAILHEYGLSEEERESYVKHIFYAMIEARKSEGVYTDDIKRDLDTELKKKGIISSKFVSRLHDKLTKRTKRQETGKLPDVQNGKIDKDFKQGKIGDCWLLAAIKALAMSEKGLEILNNSIRVLPDKSVEVTLKGVGKTYHISRQELNNSKELSTGDADVRAIEIAMDRYIKEEGGIRGGVDLRRNRSFVAYNALTGKGNRNSFSDTFGRIPDKIFTDSQIDNFNKPNHVATVSSSNGSTTTEAFCNGKKIQLYKKHAYAVKGSDSKNVYLVNPHDTSKVITVTRSDFKKFFNAIDEFDL